MTSFESYRAFAVPTVVLYAIPKALGYFCTKVEDPASRVDQFRNRMALVQETIHGAVGHKVWFIATHMLADNAWIAFIVLHRATEGNPQKFFKKDPLGAFYALIAFSAGVTCIRHVVAKLVPRFEAYLIRTNGEGHG